MAMKVMLKEIEIKKNINSKNKQKNLIFLSLLIIIKKQLHVRYFLFSFTISTIVDIVIQLYCNTLLLFTLVSSHFLFLIIPESQSFANYIAKRGTVLL